MSRAFLDSNVFLYASGDAHAYREPCRTIIDGLRRGEFRGECSTEVAQEAAHVRFRRTGDRRSARALGELIATACELHGFEPRDLSFALELFAGHERLSLRDAAHAATALNRGIELIVSADSDFDVLTDLTRLDPLDAATAARLRG